MNTKAVTLSILTVLWVLLVSSSLQAQGNLTHIRVGSFNIANFGATSEYEGSLIGLVNIMRQTDPDLIVLQEVEPNELGHAQVDRIVKLLNKAAAYYQMARYDYAIAEPSGDETTAFLWRSPVSLESEISLLPHEEDPDHDGKRTFQRTPSVALFTAGLFDFYVVNCHLYTKIQGTSSEGREAEYEAIVTWLKELADGDERDAIVLGDFNRFLGGKGIWKRLMIPNHKTHFRFPLLEAIENDDEGFDPIKHEAPQDMYSTTTSKKRSIYDQILISAGSYREFTSSPNFGVDVGIVVFDDERQYEWYYGKLHNATKMLSDHRPVWIRMRIDQNDDD